MEKELAFAIDFKTAPKELQDAATAHYANLKAIVKLEKQAAENAKAMDDAERAAEVTKKAYRVALNAWDPSADKAAK